MTKTLYYLKEFMTLHQKNPGYNAGSNAGNPYLTVGAAQTSQRKYSLEFGFGDPGEPASQDFQDYAEWKIGYATFLKPRDFNASGSYQKEAPGGMTAAGFRLWSSVTVSDDFIVPENFSYSSLLDFGKSYVDHAVSMTLDFAKAEKLPFASFLASINSATGLYDSLAGHATAQMDLMDDAWSGRITAQQLLDRSETETRTFVIDLAGQAASVPAPFLSFLKTLSSQKLTAYDPEYDMFAMGQHGVGSDGPEPVDLKEYRIIGSLEGDTLYAPIIAQGVVVAGPGNDIVFGNVGKSILVGGSGTDELNYYRIDNDLVVTPGAVHDEKRGFWDSIAGFERIVGGNGNDTIFGLGFSLIDGGKGQDTVRYIGLQTDFSVKYLADGSVRITDVRAGRFAVTTFKNVEYIWFADGTTIALSDLPASDKAPRDITLSGSSIAENMKVGSAVGSFSAFDPEGVKLIYALTDTAGGSFKLSGSRLVTAKVIDFEKVQKDTVTIEVSDGLNTITKTFAISISDIREIIKGTSSANSLTGNFGRDWLEGLAGNDKLKGYGGADVLYGGLGADELHGGGGPDIFLFRSIGESRTPAGGHDVIMDFEGFGGDKIDLTAIDANTKSAGNQAFSFIGTKGFSGNPGDLRFEKLVSDTYIYGDVNGDKTPDFAIRLDDPVVLQHGHFVL